MRDFDVQLARKAAVAEAEVAALKQELSTVQAQANALNEKLIEMCHKLAEALKVTGAKNAVLCHTCGIPMTDRGAEKQWCSSLCAASTPGTSSLVELAVKCRTKKEGSIGARGKAE